MHNIIFIHVISCNIIYIYTYIYIYIYTYIVIFRLRKYKFGVAKHLKTSPQLQTLLQDVPGFCYRSGPSSAVFGKRKPRRNKCRIMNPSWRIEIWTIQCPGRRMQPHLVFGHDLNLRMTHWRVRKSRLGICSSESQERASQMGVDQYLLIPFLGGWTSIYQLFWCELQGYKVLTHCQISPRHLERQGPFMIIHVSPFWMHLCVYFSDDPPILYHTENGPSGSMVSLFKKGRCP